MKIEDFTKYFVEIDFERYPNQIHTVYGKLIDHTGEVFIVKEGEMLIFIPKWRIYSIKHYGTKILQKERKDK